MRYFEEGDARQAPPIGSPATGGDFCSASQALAWRWSALALGIASWEIFLRADSRLLAPPTKLWLFPLLLAAFGVWGMLAGGLVGAAIATLAGPVRAHRFGRFAVVVAAAAGGALEFAFVAYHHAPGALRAWPAVAVVAAAGAFLLTRSSPAPVSPRAWSALRRCVALVAAGATLALGAALTRSDVAAALIKRQSAFGRILGHGLAFFPPRLAPPLAPPARAPDVPAARTLGRGNVILLSVDTLRHDALGVYSHARGASPNLDAFANGAVVFDDAYTQSPTSAPSMATVMTGLYPFRHGVRSNRMALATAAPTLAELLARAGYTTAAFVTNVNFSRPFHFERGFASFSYVPSQEREDGLLLDSSDPQVVDAALTWARAQPPRPFFLWVHLMAPHSPYLPPADLRPDRAAPGGPWFNVLNMSVHEARIAHRRTPFDRSVYARLYAAEVASADRLGGRLLRGLEDLGALDGAHVVVLADHGEAFGESDVFGHGRSLDQAETRVPLAWRLPGSLRTGARITTTVQLADLAPTLLRLLGLPAPSGLDGRDLSAVVLGDTTGDDGFAFTEARFLHSMGVRGLLYAVRTRRRTLWLDTGYRYAGEFDRTADPDEHAHLPYRAHGDDPLHDTLVGLAAAAQASFAAPAPPVEIDAASEKRLRALGYVQ